MEFCVLKRDIADRDRRVDQLLTPSNECRSMKLARYAVTVDELRNTRATLSDPNCVVEKLTVSRVVFTERKARILAQAITGNDTIGEIKFARSKMRVDEMQRLCEALSTSESVHTLRFGSCNLISKHCASIAQILHQNMSIKRLTLIDAGIGDNGMDALCAGIAEAINLQHIDLRYNLFETRGIKALVRALTTTFTCKVLRLQGVAIGIEEAEILEYFLRSPNCALEEIAIHEAELDAKTVEIVTKSLNTCQKLKCISFSKNDLGCDLIDDCGDTQADEEDSDGGNCMPNTVERALVAQREVSMSQHILSMVKMHQPCVRLCLSHCNLHDAGFKVLQRGLINTNIRYLNLAWNKITQASANELRSLVSDNLKLEKLLLQHNDIGEDACMAELASALKKNLSLKYLDLSATKMQSSFFKQLVVMLEKGQLQLHTLHCRKNEIRGDELVGVFKKLHLNTDLRVLSLSENFLENSTAEELKEYAQENIYIESIQLKGNKMVHSSIQDEIAEECRMNVLIQEHVLPHLTKLPYEQVLKNVSVFRSCCAQYDVESLELAELSFYSSDFVFKFARINRLRFKSLRLRSVHTTKQLTHLAIYLNPRQNTQTLLQELHLESSPMGPTHFSDIVKAVKDIKSLKILRLINLKEVKEQIKLIVKSVAKHPSLEILSLQDNALADYTYVCKLIELNSKLHTLDTRGNFMDEESLENLFLSLHQNITLFEFDYESRDTILEQESVEAIRMELEYNKQIQESFVSRLSKRLSTQESANRGRRQDDEQQLDLTDVAFANPLALIKYLKKLKSMSLLRLKGTNVKQQLLVELVAHLSEKIFRVARLDLSNLSFINDEMCEELSKLFKSDSSVTTLALNGTQITEVGLSELIDSASRNTILSSLSLANCKICYREEDEMGWKALTDPLSRNCSIRSLDLNGNQVPVALLTQITEELEKNQEIVRVIFPKIRDQETQILTKQLRHGVHKQKMKMRASRYNVGDVLLKQANNAKGTFLMQPYSSQKAQMSKQLTSDTLLGNRRNSLQTMIMPKRGTSRQLQVRFDDSASNNGPTRLGGDLAVIKEFDLESQHSLPINQKELEAHHQQRPVQTVSSGQHMTESSISESSSALESEMSISLSKVSHTEHAEKKHCSVQLTLDGLKLKKLDFLTKFVREFPRIKHIDLGNNAITNKEMQKFMDTALKENAHIQQIDVGGNKIGGQIKELMKKELQKNKAINGLVNEETAQKLPGLKSGRQTLILKDKGVDDISFINKLMLNDDFAFLQVLDLSGNSLADSGAKQVADLLRDNNTIKKLDIRKNNFTVVGLQEICSVLSASEGCSVEELDIRENRIPDRSLKMLMGMLYINSNITVINYSVYDPENIQKLEKFKELQEKPGVSLNDSAILHLMHAHHMQIKCWQKVVCCVWMWKSFLHSKHEAFRFKYDSDVMQDLEKTQMRPIGRMMYFLTVLYFVTMFMVPMVYIEGECGEGIHDWVFYFYGAQALATGLYEICAVISIQKRVNNKEILSFNKWHGMELMMGQVARLDTFLDTCFLVMLIQCDLWMLVYPVTVLCILYLLYPMKQIFTLCKVNKTLSHTQPFMERNCQLAFIRENMLLATVLDSFCVNNSTSVCRKPVAFGKLMGAWTFIFQDFPQLSIHLYFLIFMHDPASLILHHHPLVLVSLVVSTFAVMISLFNFTMFQQNEFDPIVIEHELALRRERKEKKAKAEKIGDQKKKLQDKKTDFKKRLSQKFEVDASSTFAKEAKKKMQRLQSTNEAVKAGTKLISDKLGSSESVSEISNDTPRSPSQLVQVRSSITKKEIGNSKPTLKIIEEEPRNRKQSQYLPSQFDLKRKGNSAMVLPDDIEMEFSTRPQDKGTAPVYNPRIQ